jgi:hypothetical protein
MVKAPFIIAPSARGKDMHGRGHLEPTGPATNLINGVEFVEEADACLKRMAAYKLKLEEAVVEDAVRERCSLVATLAL